MTSVELGNGLGNKSFIPRSNRQIFVEPSMLVRGTIANSEGHLESSTIIDESTDSLLMRQSLIRDNCSDRDPFNPMRHFLVTVIMVILVLHQYIGMMLRMNVFLNDDIEVYHEHRANLRRYNITKTWKEPTTNFRKQVVKMLQTEHIIRIWYCKRVQRLEMSHIFFKCSLKLTKRVLSYRKGFQIKLSKLVKLNATRRKNEILTDQRSKQKMRNFKILWS
ncbi:hypothetical protein Cgig2_018911 [Carnegiea gigantea]|uniref:Uncharacterized protein n=1 Tax=Carnegiea gigantea TaxID=171969 RepID=A0A9Q1QCS5_9CARY|nr:hypothetical protein Cgig2_018911 [Carnegiea gigantea]